MKQTQAHQLVRSLLSLLGTRQETSPSTGKDSQNGREETLNELFGNKEQTRQCAILSVPSLSLFEAPVDSKNSQNAHEGVRTGEEARDKALQNLRRPVSYGQSDIAKVPQVIAKNLQASFAALVQANVRQFCKKRSLGRTIHFDSVPEVSTLLSIGNSINGGEGIYKFTDLMLDVAVKVGVGEVIITSGFKASGEATYKNKHVSLEFDMGRFIHCIRNEARMIAWKLIQAQGLATDPQLHKTVHIISPTSSPILRPADPTEARKRPLDEIIHKEESTSHPSARRRTAPFVL